MFITRASLRHDAGEAGNLSALLKSASDGYSIHRLLWTLFSDSPERARDFLFREMDERRRSFLIVSERPPVDSHNLWDLEIKPYAPQLYVGQHLRFSLRANPVVAVPVKDKRGMRADVVMHLQKSKGLDRHTAIEVAGRDWMQRQAEKAGFKIATGETEEGEERLMLQADGYIQHRLQHHKGERPIRYSTLDLDGELIVTDPDRMKQSLLTGIGRGKSFGCGLLLIKPVYSSLRCAA